MDRLPTGTEALPPVVHPLGNKNTGGDTTQGCQGTPPPPIPPYHLPPALAVHRMDAHVPMRTRSSQHWFNEMGL